MPNLPRVNQYGDSATVTNNRGSVQLNWSIPITRTPSLDNVNVLPLIDRELRFYVQFFTGYGETLLDYNHYQTTIGIGIMVTDWM